MKHYPHHIGDFDRATRHLTRIERSIYRDLIDLYYDTEQRLTLDMPALCRRIIARSNEESTAVEQVLNEFFTETPTGWYHVRCEEEIEAYRANTSQKAMAGKASAEAKRLKKLQALNGNQTPVEQPLNSVETDDNGTPTNHQPSTINQEDISSGSTSIPTISAEPDQPKLKLVSKTIPDCPHADILALWAEKLPAAIQPADWNEKRQQALRSRWREKSNRQKLDWWARFFEYIAQSDFLMGRTNTPGRKAFALSLDWLCKSENFLKVIEGRFHEQEAVAV